MDSVNAHHFQSSAFSFQGQDSEFFSKTASWSGVKLVSLTGLGEAKLLTLPREYVKGKLRDGMY